MLILCVLLVWLLVRSHTAMDAALTACRLFTASVLPGLFPYMVPALMLTSRLPGRSPPAVLLMMGWCGGSPTGARLLAMCPELDRRTQRRLAVSCATMSPMFLLGTVPQWTGQPHMGTILLVSVVAGGYVTGLIAGAVSTGGGRPLENAVPSGPLSFSDAVLQAARTMLLVCGTMMLLRVAAALTGELFSASPTAALMLTTLLEVTSGTAAIAQLPLSPAWTAALIAAAVGFGGTAILLQNRAAYPDGLLSLPEQLLWQAVHALLSGGMAYALACLFLE